MSSRKIPHDLEAEQAVLGAMLLSDVAVNTSIDLLEASDFYKPAHSLLFSSMEDLARSGISCDPLTVRGHLSADDLDQIGGSQTILELQSRTPTIANTEAYCNIVKDKSRLRSLINIGRDISESAYAENEKSESVLLSAEEAVYGLAMQKAEGSTVLAEEALESMMESMSESWLSPDGIVGTPTGFRDVDRLLSGLRSSALYVLGARPGMGKSALAANIATNVAIDQGLPVLWFNLEMSSDEVMQRVLASRSGVSLNATSGGGMLSNLDWIMMASASRRIAGAPLLIDSDPNVKPIDIQSRARKAKARFGALGLVIVDYMQLMTGNSKAESRQLEISEISRGLKLLSKELDCPVLGLSQLSRRLESREDKRPMLSDLRESGAIEQDADVVMFLYRDDRYIEDSVEQNSAELIVAKQRQGPTGVVKLAYIGEQTRFATIATEV